VKAITMFDNNYIVLTTLAIILISTIALLIYLHKQNAPVRTTIVQIIAIILFVPLVFVLAFTGKVGENTLSTLLGAFVGYVFGKTSLPEEWRGGQASKKS